MATGADLQEPRHLVWMSLLQPFKGEDLQAACNSFRMVLDPDFLQSDPVHIKINFRF